MTFKEAFAKARKEKGAGATFTWNGKQYTTDFKEEKASAPSPSGSRPRSRPSATPPEVTTTRISNVRGGRGDGGAENTRRRSDRAIDRASRSRAPSRSNAARAGASNPPAQTNTRLARPSATVGQRLKKFFDSLPKANRGRS